MESIEVKGLTALNRTVPILLRLSYCVIDFITPALILILACTFFGIDIFENKINILIFTLSSYFIFFLQLGFLKKSISTLLFSIRLSPSKKNYINLLAPILYIFPYYLIQNQKRNKTHFVVFLFMILIGFFINYSFPIFYKKIFFYHLAFPIQEMGFIESPHTETSIRMPFFYWIAQWPKSLEENTINYQLEYKKGPPKVFIPTIRMIWKSRSIELTLEGPKTPVDSIPRTEQKKCTLLTQTEACFELKKNLLKRHVTDWNKRHFHINTFHWFHVAESQSEGIYLKGENKSNHLIEEKWILITENGNHQLVTLLKKENTETEFSSHLLEQIIRSSTLETDLKKLRAFANQKLSDFKTTDDSAQNQSLAQLLLLSKLSVKPDDINAYYHFAGISYLQLKAALKNQPLIEASETTALLKPNISASLAYLKDIAPEHIKTRGVEKMKEDLNQ